MKQTKIRLNLTVAPDTKDRLRAYADERHTTVSQAITDWIWRTPLDMERGKEADGR